MNQFLIVQTPMPRPQSQHGGYILCLSLFGDFNSNRWRLPKSFLGLTHQSFIFGAVGMRRGSLSLEHFLNSLGDAFLYLLGSAEPDCGRFEVSGRQSFDPNRLP
jgi:hypothetical protein